jgi:hypothetical protein
MAGANGRAALSRVLAEAGRVVVARRRVAPDFSCAGRPFAEAWPRIVAAVAGPDADLFRRLVDQAETYHRELTSPDVPEHQIDAYIETHRPHLMDTLDRHGRPMLNLDREFVRGTLARYRREYGPSSPYHGFAEWCEALQAGVASLPTPIPTPILKAYYEDTHVGTIKSGEHNYPWYWTPTISLGCLDCLILMPSCGPAWLKECPHCRGPRVCRSDEVVQSIIDSRGMPGEGTDDDTA